MERGLVVCYPTTVEHWQGMPLTWNTSDRQNGKKNLLNYELARRGLCRCSIYVVNIIPKQNKSTKHIIFNE
jgi:hypothetical protein